jgi:hypothetical protein
VWELELGLVSELGLVLVLAQVLVQVLDMLLEVLQNRRQLDQQTGWNRLCCPRK